LACRSCSGAAELSDGERDEHHRQAAEPRECPERGTERMLVADGQGSRGIDGEAHRVDIGKRVHDPGMELVGTNAEEANTSGNTQMNPTDWAVSHQS
jgi:hypothetical protein